MRFAVVGAGGVGGFFGGLLAAAGEDVAFLARGPHLSALQKHGLRLTGWHGERDVAQLRASDDPADLPAADVVLFCVKLYDTESAGTLLPALLAADGVVITLQNGVDGAERLARFVGAERVMAGTAYVSALIERPGVIRTTSAMAKIAFGEADGRPSARAEAVLAACGRAGFEAELSTDIQVALWRKFVLLATNAGLTCLVRQPLGVVYGDPVLAALAADAMAEVAAVGRARGVALPPETEAETLRLAHGLPPDMTTSMHEDLKRGRRLELESLSGLVVRQGAELGVPTPVHRVIWGALKPWKDGRPGG